MGYSPVTGEFPAQKASYAENISIWLRHHGIVHSQWTALETKITFWRNWPSSFMANQMSMLWRHQKNIAKHKVPVDTNVSWPDPKQLLIGFIYISDLIMIKRLSTNILKIIKREMGKLKSMDLVLNTHSIEYTWYDFFSSLHGQPSKLQLLGR